MKAFYVSLTRGLVGYYIKFTAENAEIVRRHMNEYYSPRCWCSIYEEEKFIQLIGKYKTEIVNEEHPVELGNDYRWE